MGELGLNARATYPQGNTNPADNAQTIFGTKTYKIKFFFLTPFATLRATALSLRLNKGIMDNWYSEIDDEVFFDLGDRLNSRIYRHVDIVMNAVELFYERFLQYPTKSYRIVWNAVNESCRILGISYKDIEYGGRFHPETIFKTRVKAERYNKPITDFVSYYHRKIEGLIDGYTYRLELIKQ